MTTTGETDALEGAARLSRPSPLHRGERDGRTGLAQPARLLVELVGECPVRLGLERNCPRYAIHAAALGHDVSLLGGDQRGGEGVGTEEDLGGDTEGPCLVLAVRAGHRRVKVGRVVVGTLDAQHGAFESAERRGGRNLLVRAGRVS